MKWHSTLLFVMLMVFPAQAFAECVDYAKIVIGFSMFLSLLFFAIFSFVLLVYWVTGGKKNIKIFIFIVGIFCLFGVFSVTAGLVKEQNNNISFLHPAGC